MNLTLNTSRSTQWYWGVSNYKLARYGGTIPNERIAFSHPSNLVHPHKL